MYQYPLPELANQNHFVEIFFVIDKKNRNFDSFAKYMVNCLVESRHFSSVVRDAKNILVTFFTEIRGTPFPTPNFAFSAA